jgi:addiction module HigA family antidote
VNLDRKQLPYFITALQKNYGRIAERWFKRKYLLNKKHISPVHPGVYLKELLGELKLSQYRLARELGVPAMRINHIVNGKRPVTAEIALRLGRYFGQNPRYWINLQSRYDMDVAEDALSDQVAREVRPLMASA